LDSIVLNGSLKLSTDFTCYGMKSKSGAFPLPGHMTRFITS
jgi:hypothetical protein